MGLIMQFLSIEWFKEQFEKLSAFVKKKDKSLVFLKRFKLFLDKNAFPRIDLLRL